MLLNKFGVKILNEINGMFAFAYLDKDGRLFLIRDRFGVKPLHYMIQDEIIYFSSEIKPLISIKKNKKINIKVYKNFFDHMATDYDEETFVEGILQVKKGHYISIKDNFEIKKWYFGNDFQFDKNIFKDKQKTIQFVEDTIVSAIDYRLRSDVPVCLTLSGGIDSTVLYTLIKERLQKNIKLYTFIHPNSDTSEYEAVIKLISSYNDFICTVQSNDTDNFNKLNEDLDILEFPIWGISSRAYRDTYDSINKGGFKVVIEGHGSDEMLGGYSYMYECAFYDYIKKLNFFKAIQILKIESESANTSLIIKSNIFIKFIKMVAKFILRRKKIKYFQEIIDWTFDFKILPIVLRAFDRLSMGSSIESRAPYMDYRVVELFKKLPIGFKINSMGSKAILREILKKYKKEHIYKNKQKMGFSSDIPRFFNEVNNKKLIKYEVENLNMNDFLKEKEKAINLINKEKIEWSDAFSISKVLLASMINKKYQLK
jgi:asparagine synthase (glutamine-hydrolysing)